MKILTLEIPGLNDEEWRRVQDTVHTLAERDVFLMRNGSATLHFDSEGTLQEIEFKYKRWKRRKKT